MRYCVIHRRSIVFKIRPMQFDPTADYYGMDISEEENRLTWDFGEFVKNLVTLANPANTQKEIIGPGEVAAEMAIDFESYYTSRFQNYLDNELLTEDQVSKISVLDTFFEDRSGDKMPGFWNDDLLDSHPDWQKVREMAQDILRNMEYDHLGIEIERTISQPNSDKGEALSVVSTKTRLRDKNAS